MVVTDVSNHDLRHARIKLPSKARPTMIPNEESHTSLLDYLLARLRSDETNRNLRIRRYANVDKMISTWQKLSKEDAERKIKQQEDGTPQAIAMNLPIQQTHMDDMVSFFSSVYAPVAGSYYEEPTDGTEDSAEKSAVIQRMNADAKKYKYYKQLCLALRSLFKYNAGGFEVQWDTVPGANDPSNGGNCSDSVDMYNLLYDPAIDDPSNIAAKAEWAALARRENRMALVKGEQDGRYKGVGVRINELEHSNGNVAMFYKYPPNHAGLAVDGQDGVQVGRADWAGYGVGLSGDSSTPLDNTHEVVRMYCWLNPSDFGLRLIAAEPPKNTYVLFKFEILDGCRIIAADLVGLDDENPTPDQPPRIPIFVGYLNQDDMGAATRSVAELLAPFQSFGSFLLNAHVSGSRGAIFGIQVYDPAMVDLKDIPAGSNTARIPTKQPDRDVRTGLSSIQGNADNGQTMDSLAKLLALMQQFFPVQALPSQIAGIDRATTNQVAAVMQGVNRRLHMLVRVIDADILGPARYEQFMNIVRNGAEASSGLTDREIMNMLGSGLAQLNREAAAQAMQQLLFAILQNPRSAEQYDVIGIMNFWSKLLNLDTDLSKFRLTPPTQAPGGAGGAPAGA